MNGHCAPKFQQLGEIFRSNLYQGLDVGASLAVTLDGELVVDLWGGMWDQEKGTPREADVIHIV